MRETILESRYRCPCVRYLQVAIDLLLASIHIHIVEPELVGLDGRQHGVPSLGRRNAITANSGKLIAMAPADCCFRETVIVVLMYSNHHRNRPKLSAPVPLSRRVANCPFRGRSHAHTLK